MNTHDVQQFMTAKGYKVKSVSDFPAAMKAPHIFEVKTTKGPFVVRAESQMKVDPQFGGIVSLERDMAVYALAADAGLPVPEVYDFDVHNGEKYLLVEKLRGVNWKEFVEKKNYSKNAFLDSLEYLGETVGEAASVEFEHHGNVYGEDLVKPKMKTFSKRLEDILQRKLEKAKPVLSEQEYEKVRSYLKKGLTKAKRDEKASTGWPVLILTNLHPLNFLVNEKTGKPTGFYDLQFSQAGHPALEMYNMGLQLFSYFDKPTFDEAREKFLQGYHHPCYTNYDPKDARNKDLETLLCIGHTISSVAFYHGAKDGLRDTWSAKFKKVLFDAIDNNEMDYVAFQDIIREKTKQPKQPML